MKDYIDKVKDKISLTREEIEVVMHEIMSGNASDEDMKAFLLALRDKGPTVDEITGAARIMRKFVVGIDTHHKIVLDTCGTGGDKRNTFNISTIAAFVVAGAGVAVAKHGNRSVSSKCGSADVLEAAGINLRIGEQYASECLDDIGIVFLFAQIHHPAMKYVGPVRKQLGVETIFNILGPLTNPAKATHQIMGVYKRDYVEPLANVLKNLGLKKAMVVHGDDGLDEITTTDKTFIAEYNGKEIISYDIDPEEIGIKRARSKDLESGDLKESLKIFESILDGERGPKRDIVLINAAYALYIVDKAKSINEGISLARESIDSGKARKKFQDLKNFIDRIPLVDQGNVN